jgi:FkbM family methyltransferase
MARPPVTIKSPCMRKLIHKLTRSTALRKIVKTLHLHLLGNWWLRHFPVVKTLPDSNIRYRARRLESLGLSVEMFDECSLYAVSGLPMHIRTFVDLGCNVGYFTCWLCRETKNTELKGLIVDANPEAIEDAQWHVEANGFRNVHVLHGLAGAGAQEGESDFFVHVSNVVSTASPQGGVSNLSNDWTQLKVPFVSIEKNWQKYFGQEPCDLLKVDIEGSEMDFFRAEPEFLKRVQAILLEWHKWRVSLDEVKTFLASNSFVLKTILHDDGEIGTAIFTRTA